MNFYYFCPLAWCCAANPSFPGRPLTVFGKFFIILRVLQKQIVIYTIYLHIPPERGFARKKKIIASLLIGIMIVNTFPVSLAAPASANITAVFLKKVTLPLPQAISSGLIAEPYFTLPVADGSGFIASVEG